MTTTPTGMSADRAEEDSIVHTAKVVAEALRAQQTSSSWERSVSTQTETAVGSLERNSVLNFLVRVGLYAVSLVALALATFFVARDADRMVGALIEGGADGFDEGRLLAVVVPVVLMALLASAGLGFALMVQSRGISDFSSGLEGLSRLLREAEAGVSRSRTLSHVLEEFLDNARRAFRLQLWFTRSLFLLFGVFLASAVVQGLVEGVDLLTAGLAAGSIASLAFAGMSRSAKNVGTQLADSTQIQLAVVNTTRQFNVVEEFLYKSLEAHQSHPETCAPALADGLRQMDEMTEKAIRLIQLFTEPENDSGAQDEKLAEIVGSDGDESLPEPEDEAVTETDADIAALDGQPEAEEKESLAADGPGANGDTERSTVGV